MSSNPEVIQKKMLAAMQRGGAGRNARPRKKRERMAEEAEGEGRGGRGAGSRPGGMGFGEGGRRRRHGRNGRHENQGWRAGHSADGRRPDARLRRHPARSHGSRCSPRSRSSNSSKCTKTPSPRPAASTSRPISRNTLAMWSQRAEVTDEGPGEFKSTQAGRPQDRHQDDVDVAHSNARLRSIRSTSIRC